MASLAGDFRNSLGSASGTRTLWPHAEEERLGEQIPALHDAGSGAHPLARVLNEDDEKNPRTRGPWTKGTVASILRTARRRTEVGLN